MDESDDEFYDVRDSFKTDASFLYETIDQRYETVSTCFPFILHLLKLTTKDQYKHQSN